MAGPQLGLTDSPYPPAGRHPVPPAAICEATVGNDLSGAAFCSPVVTIVVGPLCR
jgi:hypothetical protein